MRMPAVSLIRPFLRSRLILWTALLLTITMLVPTLAGAEVIEKKFPFELDEWFDINFEDGPITIHRVRVEAVDGNFKSRVFRPGLKNDEMVRDVQIQVEYSNDASKDIEAELEIFWLDSQGRKIDGYHGEEDMDEEERREEMTALRSTLVYGLDVAKTLSVKISY